MGIHKNQFEGQLKLTEEEIRNLIPRELLINIISGVKKRHNFSISFMLDLFQEDAELSNGTGYEYITDWETFEEVCVYLRTSSETCKKRCINSDIKAFETAKQKSLVIPNYPGFSYKCNSLGLIDFVVPIIEPISNSFIGVIFGCQKRLAETEEVTRARLKNYLIQPENKTLQKLDVNQLVTLYLKVEQTENEKITQMMETCRDIAKEISRLFIFYINTKKSEIERLEHEQTVALIHEELLNMKNLNGFWNRMPQIAEYFLKLLPVDWLMILQKITENEGEARFKVTAYQGKGLGHPDHVRNIQFVLPLSILRNEELSLPVNFVHKVGPNALYWSINILNDSEVIGLLMFGSAPTHRKSDCKKDIVERNLPRAREVVNSMSTTYHGLDALSELESRKKDLEKIKATQEELIKNLSNTLLGLTHQMGRPLFMISGVFSNIRDYNREYLKPDLFEQIELGIIVADHSRIMCRGLAKAFAIEGGSDQKDVTPEKIEVLDEIKALSQNMQKASRRKDIIFEYFDENPSIRMNKLSFLFVLYTLIDNALKYADSNSRIAFGCENEGTYCTFKVKSKGLRINPNDVENVFTKFWRSTEAKRHDNTGLGVGCWAARELIKQEEGGDLRLEVSDNLSIFIVYPPW
jgi:signal transduction histidine kinase/ligand-binding sensor protein